MEDKVTSLIGIIFGGLLALLLIASLISQNNRITTLEESRELSSIEIRLEQPDFYFKDLKDGLMDALLYYQIPEPEIVYTQVYINTNGFHRHDYNLFNLYNNKFDRYMVFEHWTGSIEYYQKCFLSKYKNGMDYYAFLETIYPKDYVKKVRLMHDELFNNLFFRVHFKTSDDFL